MRSKHITHLAERILKNQQILSEWLQQYTQKATLPFYCSVDLRDSGYKVVPVDSNLFPAGFNNICAEDRRTAPPIFRAQVESRLNGGATGVKKILILPESHTQNTFYIENLYYLQQISLDAGYDTQIGWFGELAEGTAIPLSLQAANGKTLQAHPIQINDGILSAGGFVPDLILLNNDFSSGYPTVLDSVKQPLFPSHTLGWHSRKKSTHFKHYNDLAGEFAALIGIDPWIIQIETEEVSPVNFNEGIGIEAVTESTERLLKKIQKAYDDRHIHRKPFAFIKNNSGTYGMGIMVVHSADELKQLNRRSKNKMSIGKNKLPIESVVIQEGVPTVTHVNHLVAEPVIYLLGDQLIGGFFRSNTEKGDEENLNSQGMIFKKLCMSDLRNTEGDTWEEGEALKNVPALELVYGSVARLATLAAGLELSQPLFQKKTLLEPLFQFPKSTGGSAHGNFIDDHAVKL